MLNRLLSQQEENNIFADQALYLALEQIKNDGREIMEKNGGMFKDKLSGEYICFKSALEYFNYQLQLEGDCEVLKNAYDSLKNDEQKEAFINYLYKIPVDLKDIQRINLE